MNNNNNINHGNCVGNRNDQPYAVCIHGCITFKSTCTPQSAIDDVLNDDVFNRHGIPKKTAKKIALHYEKIEKDKDGN